MTNKNIAKMGIIGLIVFIIAYLAGEEGVLYYGGMAAFYTSVIWGWNRLIKS